MQESNDVLPCLFLLQCFTLPFSVTTFYLAFFYYNVLPCLIRLQHCTLPFLVTTFYLAFSVTISTSWKHQPRIKLTSTTHQAHQPHQRQPHQHQPHQRQPHINHINVNHTSSTRSSHLLQVSVLTASENICRG